MNKKLFLIPLAALPLLACGPTNTSSSSASKDVTIDDQFLRDLKQRTFDNEDSITKIDFKTSLDERSEEGTIQYGTNLTKMESTLLVEGEEVDEEGNPVLVPTKNLGFAQIKDGKLTYVYSKESEPTVSQSIIYSISDEEGENNITESAAETMLRGDQAFANNLSWFYNLADDSYVEGFPNLKYKSKWEDDNLIVTVSSRYDNESINQSNTYKTTFTLDSDLNLIAGTFDNNQYKLDDYIQNGAENIYSEPLMEYHAEITLGFDEQDVSFDATPYFASSISKATFSTDSSKDANVVILNEVIDFSIDDYEGEKALDLSNFRIISSTNTEAIAEVEGTYRAVGLGKSTLTIGNPYNDVTFSTEVTVKRPELFGFEAYIGSTKADEATLAVGGTDTIMVYFSPEGAEPAATYKLSADGVISITNERVEKIDGTTYLIYDVSAVGEGEATVTIAPMAAPSTTTSVKFTVEAAA